MKQCRECGTLSPDDTVFCYICGTKFHENNAEEKTVDSENEWTNNGDNSVSDSTNVGEVNQSALRMNGVYYFIKGGFRYLLKFNSDGMVQGTSDTNITMPSASEIRGISYRDQGHYSVDNEQISFSLINQQGQVDNWGEISNNSLILNLHSHINGHQALNEVYQFVEM